MATDTRVGERCVLGDDCGGHANSFCVGPEGSEPIFTSFWGGDEQEGGGVAGGYCTRTCEIDTDCPTGSRCGGGICLASCEFGSPTLPSLTAELSETKCHGRDDLMCVPVLGGDSVCMPNCGASGDCGTKECDARYGVCTNPSRSGELYGSQCVVDNTNTDEDEDACAGLCLEIVDETAFVTATMCSGRCSFGGTEPDCGGPLEGVCAIPRVEEDGIESQLGDGGFCATACEQHDQCAFESGILCLDLGNFDAMGKGYCVRADSCENEQSCATGKICLATAAGKVCLDDDGTGEARIPLGGAAL